MANKPVVYNATKFLELGETSFKEKVSWGAIIAGGLIALGGAVYLYRSRDKRVAELGQVIHQVEAGGMVLKHHREKNLPIEKRIKILQDLTYSSIHDPRMRKIALELTQHCPERDGLCEAKAIYDAVKARVRYTGDVAPIKHPDGSVEGIDLYQSAYRTYEDFRGGDCLPARTLLLTEGFKLVPIEELKPGMRIWGRDNWTEVTNVWFKGILPVDAVFLNNGSSFKATEDHKVYVALCKKHPVCWEDDKGCSCPMSEREIQRLKLSEVCPSMVVVAPERIAFGTETFDPDRALIEGLYLSDGWCSHVSDFDIAGRDGHPKEEQKRLVESICARMDIPTTWFDKSIRVLDKEWALRMQSMGKHATQKHALSINLEEGAAAALLRGIMADSGANTHGNGRTFTTTSRELAMQVRLLHKMFGMTCSERYIVDHGGLGENPIWRLGVRDRTQKKAEKLLRIKAIEREVMSLPVYDLTTADHYVYLPEADVTVSNCDDHSVTMATLMTLNGIPTKFRVTAPRPNAEDSHIYCVVGLAKTSPTKWIAADTTLPGNENFGKEARNGRAKDYPV